MRDIRLGDDIDDFCVRCKRVMNHNVVSVLNGAAGQGALPDLSQRSRFPQ